MEVLSQVNHKILKRRRGRSGTSLGIKSGPLIVVVDQEEGNIKGVVYIRVVSTLFEQVIEIYTDPKFTTKYGFISLRKCRVAMTMDGSHTFVVTKAKRQNDHNNKFILRFQAQSKEEAHDWVAAMKCVGNSDDMFT